MDVHFESPDVERLLRALERLNRRGIAYAARNSLNDIAFRARTEWKGQIAETFTLRNTWTARSLRVEKARGTRIRSMVAVVGSLAPYLATQEHGDTERKRGRFGVPIPTARASGEARGTRPRRRRVRRPNRLPSIQLRPRPGQSRRQRNAATIAMALRSRRKFVFLELPQRRGIFRLMGGRRRPRLEMIWDLSHSSVRIPPRPTLTRAIELVLPQAPLIAERQLLRQIERARFPKYRG